MGEFPTGALVGVCGSVFQSLSSTLEHCAAWNTLSPSPGSRQWCWYACCCRGSGFCYNQQAICQSPCWGGCQNKFDIKLFCLFGFCLVWRCPFCFLTLKSHQWQDLHPPSHPPPHPKKSNTDFEIVKRESSLYLIDDENILKCFQEGSKTEVKPYVAVVLLRAFVMLLEIWHIIAEKTVCGSWTRDVGGIRRPLVLFFWEQCKVSSFLGAETSFSLGFSLAWGELVRALAPVMIQHGSDV